MAIYKISGIWKNGNEITHYAFHKVVENGILKAEKLSKANAIALLETKGNSAMTWMWNYKDCKWRNGENVEVINAAAGKYLRTDADSKITDNLQHLIDYDWIK